MAGGSIFGILGVLLSVPIVAILFSFIPKNSN
jgi:predicted PurR-regulated permease PerM